MNTVYFFTRRKICNHAFSRIRADERLVPFREAILAALHGEGIAAMVVNGSCEADWPQVEVLARQVLNNPVEIQVGGRSGRGDRPGRVVVQTLDPEARPIALAAAGKEEEFYAEELERRRELGYPPAGFLVGFDLSGTSRDKVDVAGQYTADRLTARLGELAQVLGPGPLWRERGRHACRLVIKTTETGKTLDVLRDWLAANRDRYAARGVRVVPDVEPQWL